MLERQRTTALGFRERSFAIMSRSPLLRYPLLGQALDSYDAVPDTERSSSEHSFNVEDHEVDNDQRNDRRKGRSLAIFPSSSTEILRLREFKYQDMPNSQSPKRR